jgi:hypothetical protein
LKTTKRSIIVPKRYASHVLSPALANARGMSSAAVIVGAMRAIDWARTSG